MSQPRVCIVSSGSLSSGPRIEKEADALASAGYRVHVLVLHSMAWMADWDARIAAGKAFSYQALRFPGGAVGRGLARALSRGCESVTTRLGPQPLLAELAFSENTLPLLLRGLVVRADLFIAHNLAALPVAHALARFHRAHLAFDAEDDHLGELPDRESASPRAALIDAVQRRHLPACDYVTAASQGIADALAARYPIAAPTVVLNVFPFALRAGLDGRRVERRGSGLSLCWYSQSLGFDRGLQDAITAAGCLRGEFELHLRGHAPEPVRRELVRMATALGVASRLFFHPQVHPHELLSRVAEHDVGLALEQPVSRNKLQTVSNKLFFYMLAGLAVGASDTPGQRAIMQSVPEAGFCYAPGEGAALARGLQRFIDQPSALAHARDRALAAARDRYCFEREADKLRACVDRVLG